MTAEQIASGLTKARWVVRPRFLRKPIVVLQVSERIPYNYDPATDIRPGGYIDVWRDARPEDVAIAAWNTRAQETADD